MSVIAVADTGHVVAALTRTADPDGELAAAAIAPSGLRLRGLFHDGGDEPLPVERVFTIPADLLKVVTIDYDRRILIQPTRFAVDGETAVELGAHAKNIQAGPTSVLVRPSVGLATAEYKVVCVIAERRGPTVRVATGSVPDGTPHEQVTLTVNKGGAPAPLLGGSGTHDFLTLVAGFVANVDSKTF